MRIVGGETIDFNREKAIHDTMKAIAESKDEGVPKSGLALRALWNLIESEHLPDSDREASGS